MLAKKLHTCLRDRARPIVVLTEHHLSGAQLSALSSKLSRLGLALTAVEARATGKGKGRTGGIAIVHDKTVPIARTVLLDWHEVDPAKGRSHEWLATYWKLQGV